jgi:hypothetical protein
MFPLKAERESAFDLDDLVDHVVFGAECRASERGGGRRAGRDAGNEAVIICGDAWLRFCFRR